MTPLPFLNPQHGPLRNSAAEDRPFPPRDGNRISPLILGAEMFPELEERVLAARNRVFLAFRIFDPATAARSASARERGLPDWKAILKAKLEEGVTIRFLLTDFEPTVAHGLHAGSWETFRALREVSEELPEEQRERFEIIVSQHPGELGWALRQLLRLPMGIMLRRMFRRFAQEQEGADIEAMMDLRPGLWRYHRISGGEVKFRRGPAPRMWPSTHHHKFAVIDDATAIIGGLDVNERRYETRRYRSPAPESWHDVSVLVVGPAAGDAAEHFRRMWNAELPRFREITSYWVAGQDRQLAVDPLDEMPEPVPSPAPLAGGCRAQVLRTRSRKSRSPFAIGPRDHIRELLRAHRNIIFAARRTLYIEAQFFRSRRASRWVAEAARRNPQLEVIILLPQAPEEVAFAGQTENPAHRHGEWLQSRALGRLLYRLGPRVGLFALGRKAELTAEERETSADGGAAFGAGMIYVHSKLIIADDRYALVSSANINGRSFAWDSEFGLLWEDAEGISAFRRRLWGQLLDVPPADLPPPGQCLHLWRDIADENVRRRPPERQGHVLPYRYARARRFGRPGWFVPDDFV